MVALEASISPQAHYGLFSGVSIEKKKAKKKAENLQLQLVSCLSQKHEAAQFLHRVTWKMMKPFIEVLPHTTHVTGMISLCLLQDVPMKNKLLVPNLATAENHATRTVLTGKFCLLLK